MVAIEQTFTPYLTGAKSFVNAMINLHLFKEFLVKYWVWILLGVGVIGFFIYKIIVHSQAEEKKFQKLLEKSKTEAQPNPTQQITNQLFKMQ